MPADAGFRGGPIMLRHPLARGTALVCTLALTAALAAAGASAQCLVTGPDSMCGGSVQLCGPPGLCEYEWTGPNGFLANTECVTVTQPGVYSLRVFDCLNGLWFGPCTHTVASGTGPSCSITGPTSGCEGTPVELCGPGGGLEHQWTGPNGFSATTACVSVSVSGTYQLVVRDPATGCSSAPCQQDVVFQPCRTLRVNCPRKASFWARQCSPRDPARVSLSPEQLAQVAAGVDERAASLNWEDDRDSFCRAVRWSVPCNVRMRAKRQFVAALANVCAGSLGLVTRSGQPVALDPDTPLQLGDLTTTVGAWLAYADARIAELEGRSLNDRQVRLAYRELIHVAWNINHGRGIGEVCGSQLGGLVSEIQPTSGALDDDEDAVDPDDASLLIATADDAVPTLIFERPAPNPFSSSARIAYTVTDASEEDVVIGVYDLTGRLVRELVRERQAPGRYEVQWDGQAADGGPAKNGVYFVNGRVGRQPVQARLTLLR